jgi:hypothetical protein
MPHLDLQFILAMAIVAAAAFAILRRLWRQALAFRSRPRRKAAPADRPPAPPASSPLLQVQLKPPVHLKRPPADDQ